MFIAYLSSVTKLVVSPKYLRKYHLIKIKMLIKIIILHWIMIMNKAEAYSIKDFNCNDFTLGNCTDDENLIWENNQVSLNLHRRRFPA